MLTGALASPAAAQFLAGFQCDPFKGTMQIPLAQLSPTNDSEYRITLEAISESSRMSALLLQQQLREGSSQLPDNTLEPIPNTDEQWVIIRERGKLCFRQAGPKRLSRTVDVYIPEDGVKIGNIGFADSTLASRATMEFWTFPESEYPSDNWLSYTLFFVDAACIGLKVLLGLPVTSPLHRVQMNLFNHFDIGEGELLEDADVARILTMQSLSDSPESTAMPALSAHNDDGLYVLITPHLRPTPGGLTFTEDITITVSQLARNGLFAALPEELHSLWNFAAGADSDELPDMNVGVYRELTRRIYASPSELPSV